MGVTPLNIVPGCQCKMFNVPNLGAPGARDTPVQGETEVMRIACMYPPLNVWFEKTGIGQSAEGILSSSWLDTNVISTSDPSPYWNCFAYAVNKVGGFSAPTTITVNYFMKCIWECRTRKWTNYIPVILDSVTHLTDEENKIIKDHRELTKAITN